MIGQRLLAVAVLACSVFVLGTMAASMDATIASSPDDAIDVDTDALPFVGEDASEIADSYRQAEDGSTQRESQPGGNGAAARSGGGSDPDVDQGAGSVDGRPRARGEPGDGPSRAGGAGEQGSSGGSGDRSAGSGGSQDRQESPWDLLQAVLVAVLALVALLVLVGAGVVLYRRRHRLLAYLRDLAGRYGLGSERRPARAAAPSVDGGGDTVVERAWGEMIRASGARPHRGATPRECAGAAIAAGVDREPAEALTELFERTRYGDWSPTSDQESRARSWLRQAAPNARPPAATGGAGVPDGGVRVAGDPGRFDDGTRPVGDGSARGEAGARHVEDGSPGGVDGSANRTDEGGGAVDGEEGGRARDGVRRS